MTGTGKSLFAPTWITLLVILLSGAAWAVATKVQADPSASGDAKASSGAAHAITAGEGMDGAAEQWPAGWRILGHELTVDLDPDTHLLTAEDRITCALESAGETGVNGSHDAAGDLPPLELQLNRNLNVEAVTDAEGREVAFELVEPDAAVEPLEAESVNMGEGAAVARILRITVPPPANAAEDVTGDGEGHPSGHGSGHPTGAAGGHPAGRGSGHPAGAASGHPSGAAGGHPSGHGAGQATGQASGHPGSGAYGHGSGPAPQDTSGNITVALTIRYAGEIYDPVGVAQFSREMIADQTTGLISPEGTYLSASSIWYPTMEDAVTAFRVTTRTPPGVETLTLGTLVERAIEEDGRLRLIWDNPDPADECVLVAGRYQINRIVVDGVEVLTYFFPSEADLVEQYLGASARYVRMYNEMLGPYPYTKFAVVENFFPTGYGMPSFTLLGQRVIRLPFIVYTSLGHEIAHNWWGNSVFVDWESGNWCEGLTTYLADHHYKNMRSPAGGVEYRRGICRDFTVYVNESNDFPLVDFRGRTTPPTRAIGYGKGAMFFHMLRVRLGDETFFDGLRKVYDEMKWEKASFEDFRLAFEAVSGEDLGSFFDQWAGRPGAPLLRLENVSVEKMETARYRITAELVQDESAEPFQILVPVEAVLEGDARIRELIRADAVRTPVTMIVDSQPERLVVDPGVDCFRRLHPEEVPATLSLVLGDDSTLVVLPSGGSEALRQAYRSLAARLSRTGESALVEDTALSAEQAQNHALILLGGPEVNRAWNDALENALPGGTVLGADGMTLNGTAYKESGAAVLVSMKHPADPQKGICCFAGLSPEGVTAAGGKLIHYGKYSYLAFVDGTNRDKGIFEPDGGPLVHRFIE